MANSAATKFFSLLITFMVAAAPHTEAAITCGNVLSSLSPCLSYLQRGGALPPSCCEAVKSLNNAASTTPDRQTVCGCIKTLVPSVGAKEEFINSIPAKCGVDIPYKYSPSLDCSKVK